MKTMWRWGMILISTSGSWCAITAGSPPPPPPRSSASVTPTGSLAASQSSQWTSVRWVTVLEHLHNQVKFCSGIWVKGSLFAHEFGHALGRAIHDSEVGLSIFWHSHCYLLSPQLYEDEDYQLIMNANVGKEANIWSPEARSFIRDQVQLHDNMDEKSRGKSYNELFQGIKYHESCLKDLNPENDPLPLV